MYTESRREISRRESRGRLRSFLRWVGGKRLLTTKLLTFLPLEAADRPYREPFVGAASLFLALRPKKATLSDLNPHLIDCYRLVRDDHEGVARHLRRLAAEHSKLSYYAVRTTYNRYNFSAAQAARFIYLNRTCFNGVFRVNRKGFYNVPFGDKEHPTFPTTAELRNVSQVLQSARISARDYLTALRDARSGDLIYLDPPYPPLNGTSYFTHYTVDRFTLEQQRQLAEVFAVLDRRGCFLIMTNADIPLVRRLYRAYYSSTLSVPRYVTCKTHRHNVSELVITNYPPPRTS